MLRLGFDEAGRGPWAGPLFVAIVSLSNDIEDLNDSKKLTRKKRDELIDKINQNALCVGVGAASADYIDKHGLTKATIFAAEQALGRLNIQEEFEVIIDGNYDYLPKVKNKQIVIKADAKFPEVSAASVVAKVLRDRYMQKVAVEFPEYGFDSHFGYGTAKHKEALHLHGICKEHRKSFTPIKQFI